MDTLNGYLRLYCKIFGPPKGMPPPRKRCRVCGDETDEKCLARKAGIICPKCYREKNRVRTNLYYRRNRKRIMARNKLRYDGRKARAWVMAGHTYRERQPCTIDDCCELGHRHHEDYDKPKDIIWLCPLHHKQYHRGELTLPV